MDVLRFLGLPYTQWPVISQVAFLVVGGILVLAVLMVASFPLRLWMRRRRQREVETQRRDASGESRTVEEDRPDTPTGDAR